MESIIKNLDWSPLFISLKTGIVATFISFFLGIYAARKVVKTTPGKKAVIDGILTLPMVLPPTVAGFFLLLIFSKRRPFGIFLYETFDIKVVQSWLGCIIAATVIAFPLMYRHSGWRLCNSGSMGSDRYAHRISCNLFHEFYIRHKDEEYQTLVDSVK